MRKNPRIFFIKYTVRYRSTAFSALLLGNHKAGDSRTKDTERGDRHRIQDMDEGYREEEKDKGYKERDQVDINFSIYF